jgi:hypothetical protein
VVNSGAWQRTIHPNDLSTIEAPLESLRPCYGYLEIATDGGRRSAQSRTWGCQR